MKLDSLVSREQLRTPVRFGLSMLPFVLCVWYAGCGAVGPPIPPEDVGIEAKLLEQQRQQEEQTMPVEGMSARDEDLERPPLRPISTR